MGKGATVRADAGASATAQWRRARTVARGRRALSAALALMAAVLLGLAVARGDGRLAAAGVSVGAIAWRSRPDTDPDRWRRGAEGEAATAALLGRLPRRWVVRHDRAVPASRANIDHLAIGPTGVWVIDTKTARAPLAIRRGAVWAGEHAIDTGPVAWEAEVVSGLLGVDAVPVVAVHGDGLRRRGKVCSGVRVVPADRLVRRLRRGRRVLGRADVGTLAWRAAELLPPR